MALLVNGKLVAGLGKPGVGIKSIERTGGDGTPGMDDIYTITLTDGSTSEFSVHNGADGEDIYVGTSEPEDSDIWLDTSEEDEQITYVHSFAGRTGAIIPQANDYTAKMVGAAEPSVVFTVTLPSSGWADGSFTVSDERFVSSGRSYIVSPIAENFSAYCEALIHACDVVTDGELTFMCSEPPTIDVIVNIMSIEVSV